MGLGISLKDHRSRPVDDKLLDQADLILTMTDRHNLYTNVGSFCMEKDSYPEGICEMENKDISDPFGQSDEAYRKTAEEIQQALKKVLDKLKEWAVFTRIIVFR